MGISPSVQFRTAPGGVPLVRWLRSGPQALVGWLVGSAVMVLSLYPVSWLAPQQAAWWPFAAGSLASWFGAYCVCRWLLRVFRARCREGRHAGLLIGLCCLIIVAVQVVATGVVCIGAGVIITPVGPIDFGNALIGP
ncbi:MAG: hypothetical protein ABR950_00635 [Candidatus Dormibacteria bacterium]